MRYLQTDFCFGLLRRQAVIPEQNGCFYTANASKLIEKCVLDFRNIFLYQENTREFFSKQEYYLA